MLSETQRQASNLADDLILKLADFYATIEGENESNELRLTVYNAVVRCCQEIQVALVHSRKTAQIEEAIVRNFGPGVVGEKKPIPVRPVSQDVKLVIGAYKTYHPQAKPGDKAKRLIAARLREGYTVDDLIRAIEGCHLSPYHCGQNKDGTKYQGIDLIFRDSEKVSRFMEISEMQSSPDSNKSVAIRNWDEYQKLDKPSILAAKVLADMPPCERSDPRFNTSYRKLFIEKYIERLEGE